MPRTLRLPIPALLAALLFAVLLGGCQTTSSDKVASSQLRPMTTLQISVTYRERMPLPPGCAMFVELLNISQLKPEDKDVANAFLPVRAMPPFKAVLKYDQEKLIKQLNYALAVRIELKGQVLFSGNTRIDPFTWPKDKPVEILVTMPRR